MTDIPDAAPRRSRRMALLTAVGLALGWAAVAAVLYWLFGYMFPGRDRLLDSFFAQAGLCAMTMFGLTAVGWRVSGMVLAAERHWGLLLVPAVIVCLPLVGGIAPGPGSLALLLLVFTLTAIAEEAMFRGVLPVVLRRFSPLQVAVITALLFGAVHAGNLVAQANVFVVLTQMAGAAIFGFGLVMLRQRLMSLWPLIILHMLGDLFMQLGTLPKLPMAIVHDILFLLYGLWLYWKVPAAGSPSASETA